MPTAEELAKDPDFIKLHDTDKDAAEKIMIEQMQQDAQSKSDSSEQSMLGKVGSFVGNAFKRGGQEFLEATPTAAKILSIAAPAGITAGIAARGGGQLAQLLGAGAGNELVTMGSRLLQPGNASMEQRLTPGVEDAASLAAPFVGQAVTHPIETGKNIISSLAKSSAMGKRAAIDVAQQQHAEAMQKKYQADAKSEYTRESESYKALQDARALAMKQEADDVRTLTMLQREANVPAIASWVEKRPGVPTPAEVSKAYEAADTLAASYGSTINIPEVTAIKKDLLKQAETTAKQPGGAEKAASIKKLATTGQETNLTLQESNEIIKGLNQDIAALRRHPDRYSQTEADALSKIVNAYEAGMANAEINKTIPEGVRASIRAANSLYLRQRTHQEMGDFLTKDMVKYGEGGQPMFSPQVALRALDSKENAVMTGYMKKVRPFDGDGKTLYDITKANLKEMASVQNAERETTRLLRQAGRDVSSGGLAIGANVATRASLAGAGYAAFGPLGLGAALGPNAIQPILSQIMMTRKGQNLLVSLVKHQGREISPAMVGMLGAALQSMQEEKN